MKRFYFQVTLALIFLFSLNLSAQTTYTFTNAGASGRFGPTQGQVDAAYGAGIVTINTEGIQEWIVPVSGTYSIQAIGAGGGTPNVALGHPGGLGADMYGEVNLTAGQVLKIVAGQEGGSHGYTAGGGGGSFVTDYANSPLVVAGGGGGGGDSYYFSNEPGGFNASTGTSGTCGHPCAYVGGYGTPGVGGYGSTSSLNGGWGQSGAGLLGDGNGMEVDNYADGALALSFINGAIGAGRSSRNPGNDAASCTGAPGGFGGGGSGACNGGGGGGGYSGGGAGGGGAGSFNAGINQVNTGGVNSGHGSVIITRLLDCQTSDATTAFNDLPDDGFGAWTQNPSSPTGNNGTYTGNSAFNGGQNDVNGDDDINSSGSAWALYANQGEIAELIRPFDNPLSDGDTFSIDMDNGWIEPGGVVGFSLRNNSGEDLLEFYFRGGDPAYIVNELNNEQTTGINFTDQGLSISFTYYQNANVLDGIVTELGTGNTTSISGTLKNPPGGQTISTLRMFNFNAAGSLGGANWDAFFNNLEVCQQPIIDNDNDGYATDVDCDDNDAAVNPGAQEICDGIDNNCDGQVDENPDQVDFANLQFPASDLICSGQDFTAYGQVYEPGITEAAGQGAGIQVEFGYDTSPDPNTWTNWTAAAFNVQVNNNDEYLYTINSVPVGDFYYTFRYSLNNCDWQYGGTNNGFWDANTNPAGFLQSLDIPQLVSVSPSQVSPGDNMTIEGLNFSPTGNIVTLSGVNAPIISENATQIVVQVPEGLCGGDVVVTSSCGLVSTTLPYTVYPPSIAGVNPPSVSPGEIMVIDGTDFSPTGNSVTVSGMSATITAESINQISVLVPDVCTGEVMVTSACGEASNPVNFDLNLPTIVSVNPSSVSAGDVLTINGTNFSSTGNSASIGALAAVIISENATQITVEVPEDVCDEDLVITTACGLVSDGFAINVNAPVITQINPNSVSPGDIMIIQGTGFSSNGNDVTIGGTTGVIVSESATEISIEIPVNSCNGDITVTSACGTGSNAIPYAVNPPTIVNVNPNVLNTEGGQAVTITGIDFSTSGNVVYIGGIQATVQSENTNTITVLSPANLCSGDISVTTTCGLASNLVSFNTAQPTIIDVDQYSFSTQGGEEVGISGTNFSGSGNTVYFDGIPGTNVLNINSNFIFVTTPAGLCGGVITVENACGDVSNPFGYLIEPPTIISINSSPVQSNSPLTINGYDFNPGNQTVTINGFNAQINNDTFNQIDVTVPDLNNACEANIQVTTCGQLSNIFSSPAVELIPPTITCPANVTINTNPGQSFGIATWADPTTSDNCGIASTSGSSNSGDSFSLSSSPSTVTYTTTDTSGNSTTCSFTVTVNDNEAPIINCPSNITVSNDPGECGANVVLNITATDNSGGTVTISSNTPSGDFYNVGTTVVTATATDSSGNTSSCNVNVTVQDNEPPVAICQDITVQLDEFGNASILAELSLQDRLDAGESPKSLYDSGVSLSELYGLTYQEGKIFYMDPVTGEGLAAAPSDQSTSAGWGCWGDKIVPTYSTIGTGQVNTNEIVNQCPEPSAARICNDLVIGIYDDWYLPSRHELQTMYTQRYAIGGFANSNYWSSTQYCNNTVDWQCGTWALKVLFINGSVGSHDKYFGNRVRAIRSFDATSSANTIDLVDNGSYDACGIQSITLSQTDFTCADIGANTVTLTVTDTSGNVSTCDATVTVVDNQNPVITCPSNITVNTDAGESFATATWADPTTNDNCGLPVTLSSNFSSGDAFSLTASGTTSLTSVTYEATDTSGNTATCSFNVTVVDNEAPTITCPSDITVFNDPGECGAIVYFNINATDNSGVVDVSSSIASGSFFNVGTTAVSATATDPSGNTMVCTFNVTVQDNEPPILVCQDVTLTLDANGTASANPFINGALVSQSDNCSVVGGVGVTGPNIYTCDNIGTFSINVIQDDLSGNQTTCTYNVTIIDPLSACNQPPVAACQNITVDADSNCSATAVASDFDGGSTDPDGDQLTYSVDNPGPYPLGTTNVILTVSDGEFTDTCTATITVEDNEAPTLSQNTALVDYVSNCEVAVPDVTGYATDNCSANFTQSPESGSLISGLNNGDPIVVTIFDENNNGVPFTLTVLDQSAPVLNPNSQVIDFVSNCEIEIPNIIPFATDNCPIGLTQNPPANQIIPAADGDTIVILVTDSNGNSSPYTLTVSDTTAPDAVCNNNIIVQLDASGNGTLTAAQVDGGSTDNCGIANVVIDNTSWSCADIATNPSTIDELFFSEYIEGSSVNKCLEIYNGTGAAIDLAAQVYSVQFYSNGNTTASTTINLTGTVAAGDVYVLCDDGAEAAFLAQADQTSTSSFYNGDDAVVLRKGSNFIDVIGQIGFDPGSQWGSDVVSTQNNTIRRKSGVSAGDTNGSDVFDPAVEWDGFANNTSDGLGTHSVSGGNTVTLTVTDVNGNSSTCTATVTVEDNIAPAVACNPIDVELDASGNYTLSQTDIDTMGAGSSDACGIASIEADTTVFSCNNVGPNNVTLTVTDNNGNAATCTAVVNVQDNTAPDAVCNNNIVVQLDASGNGTLTVAEVDGGSTDNCGVANVVIDNTSWSCADIATNPSTIDELFFSEYIEGSSVNKCLEIYNGTGAAIDLAAQVYSVQFYSNGNTTASTTINLTGTVAAGDVYVLCDDGAAAAFLAQADQTSTSSFYNGDDAVVLRKGSNFIDVIGQIGVDPGSQWGSGVVSTQDNTIRRKSGVSAGDTNGSDVFDPAVEWDGFANNTSDGLGTHSVSGGNTVTLTVTDVNGNSSSCTATVTVEDNIAPNAVCQAFTVQLDANGVGFLTAEDIDGGSDDTCGIASLSASQTDFDCSHIGTNTVTLTVTDNNGNTATCDATVTVEDNVAPTVVCNDITVELDASGNYTLTQDDINEIGLGSEDACGDVTFSVDNNMFDCSDVVADGPVVAADLFFSEYVEGSSFNKYIEIFNGTGSNVDLSDYELRLYSNGASSQPISNDLSGVLNDGNVIVYANNSAAVYGGATITASAVNWNGDDAVVLWKKSTSSAVDIFGNIGEDPGSQWSVAGITTQNQTLRRNTNILSGNIDNALGFPSLGTEWTGLAQDDVSGLGSHSLSGGNLNSPTVILTVTDVNGNTATCEATIIVEDNISPTVVCNELTVALDDTGNYSLSSSDIDAIANGSTDACGIASLSVSPESFTCGEIGFNTVTLTVTDNNGNVNTCTTTVNVVDTIAPVVVCQDLTVELDANGSASIVAVDLDGGSFDACSPITLSISQDTFDCADVNATVSINDLFFSEYVEGSSNNKYIEIFNGTGSSINLSDYQLRLYSNGNTSPNSNNTLSGTIADGEAKVYRNNSATIYGGATTVASAVNWNGDDAIELYKISTGTSVDIFGSIGEDPGSEWNVDDNETQNHTLRRNITVIRGNTINTPGFPKLGTEWTELNIDDVSGLGNHTVDARGVAVTLTATDAYGNTDSCVAIVRVEDNIAPVITCIEDDARDTNPGECDYTIQGTEFDATFTDNCADGTITNSLNGTATIAGEILTQGSTTVTWTADDGNGNIVTCTTTITVEDNEDPIIACGPALEVFLSDLTSLEITPDQLFDFVSDNCEVADISISQDNFSCDDVNGDLADLIITEYVDGPGFENYIELYNGTDVTVELSEYTLVVYYDTGAIEYTLGGTITENQPIVIMHPAASFPFPNNTQLLTFDGNDAIELKHNGNVIDILPVYTSGVSLNGTKLIRKPDVNAGNLSNSSGADGWIQVNNTTTDNLLLHDIDITTNINNVEVLVTDTSGNTATCIANVIVNDDIPPIAICQAVTVQLDDLGNGILTPAEVDNGSFDECSNIQSLTLDRTDFSCADIGQTITVTLTVTDTYDNESTCEAEITVEDNVAPEAICVAPFAVQLDDDGNASITAEDIDNGSNDACGIASMVLDNSEFTCANIGENTVTLTVTDVNGNVSSCETTVTVEDMVNPIAVCNDITIYLDPDGTYTLSSIDIDAIADGSNDNCDTDLTYSVSPSSFTCAEEGDNTVTLTVTDDYGNSSTCTATVTVDGSFPEVTISQSELPEFCQGAVVVLTANSDEAVEYLWSTGEDTASIEVGANGIYSVLVTSATNCEAYAEFEVIGFDPGALVAAYTILAQDEVFLHGNNLVQTGGVGAMNPNTGNIKLHQATTVVGFGQAPSITLNQGSTIGSQVLTAANPTVPPFVFNTYSNNSSPDATVNNNQTQTLNGSVYDVVTVKQNATVIFSQSNVYINELKTFDGASIEFENCANVFINDKFMLAQNGTINADDPNKVVFYVNEDVQIEKGSDVRASIHAYNHELLAKGSNSNGNNAGEPTYMTGLFIANRVHGNKNVIWNADDLCDPCPVAAPLNGEIVNVPENSRLQLDIEVEAWPNPSDTHFNLKLKTAIGTEDASIEVYDMNNKLIHRNTFKHNETYQFGRILEGGVYIVKIKQGGKEKFVRLVRY